VAGAARVRLRARRGARSAAVAAGDDAVVAHRLRAAEGGLLERDGQLALDVAAVAPPDAEHAEQVPEDPVDRDLAEVDDAAREGAAARERRAWLLGAVPEAVVHRLALRVAEDLIRGVDLLESHGCAGISGV